MTTVTQLHEFFEEEIFEEAILALEDAPRFYQRFIGEDGDIGEGGIVETVIGRAEVFSGVCAGNSVRQVFSIVIQFTKEFDDEGPREDEEDDDEPEGGVNHAVIRDFLEEVVSLVRTDGGKTWGGLIDYYRPPSDVIEVTEVIIKDEKYYRARIKFTAEKTA